MTSKPPEFLYLRIGVNNINSKDLKNTQWKHWNGKKHGCNSSELNVCHDNSVKPDQSRWWRKQKIFPVRSSPDFSGPTLSQSIDFQRQLSLSLSPHWWLHQDGPSTSSGTFWTSSKMFQKGTFVLPLLYTFTSDFQYFNIYDYLRL